MTSPIRWEGGRPRPRSAEGGPSYLRCHHCRQHYFHTWGHWLPRRNGIRTWWCVGCLYDNHIPRPRTPQ